MAQNVLIIVKVECVLQVTGYAVELHLCKTAFKENVSNGVLGKRFKNATNCVVSCCEGENCNPSVPLKCFQCQGKGRNGYLFSIFTDLDRRKNPLLG